MDEREATRSQESRRDADVPSSELRREAARSSRSLKHKTNPSLFIRLSEGGTLTQSCTYQQVEAQIVAALLDSQSRIILLSSDRITQTLIDDRPRRQPSHRHTYVQSDGQTDGRPQRVATSDPLRTSKHDITQSLHQSEIRQGSR